MKLLALIIAFVISHAVAKPQRYRNFAWLKSWSDWFQNRTNLTNNDITLIVILAAPITVISLILFALFSSHLGGLLVSILVLSYCIGPESLDEEVDSGEIRSRLNVRKNAKISLLIKKMTQVSMRRWFGVFFWYVVLGILGVLVYRFAERLNFYTPEENKLNPSIEKLMKILNYPVSWLMVVSLAIASDFERIFKKCKPYMNLSNLTAMDDSFLYEATDFAVENCEIEPESNKTIEQVTISVLKRMLIVWLVIVAILVILAV